MSRRRNGVKNAARQPASGTPLAKLRITKQAKDGYRLLVQNGPELPLSKCPQDQAEDTSRTQETPMNTGRSDSWTLQTPVLTDGQDADEF